VTVTLWILLKSTSIVILKAKVMVEIEAIIIF